MPTRKSATFTVTRVDRYTCDIGEIPPAIFEKLIGDAAEQWIPTLFIGDTDFSLGEGGEFGGATNVSIEVEVD